MSSRSSIVDAGGRTAWYRLSPGPDEFSEVCIGERRSMFKNPGLEELVAVVDEVEKAIRVGSPLGGR